MCGSGGADVTVRLFEHKWNQRAIRGDKHQHHAAIGAVPGQSRDVNPYYYDSQPGRDDCYSSNPTLINGFYKIMKKFIMCVAAALLVSLSACSSSNAPNTPEPVGRSYTNNSGTQSLVPFPDSPGTSLQPTATPNLPNN
jgi:hypothetical protein